MVGDLTAFPFTRSRYLWAFGYQLDNWRQTSVICGWYTQPMFTCATGSQTIRLAISRH